MAFTVILEKKNADITNFIGVVKALRGAFGFGLKEAKDIADYARAYPQYEFAVDADIRICDTPTVKQWIRELESELIVKIPSTKRLLKEQLHECATLALKAEEYAILEDIVYVLKRM